MTVQQDLVYGRRGGAWASKPEGDRHGQKVHVPAHGGPLDGLELLQCSWGEQPEPAPEVPMSAGGQYRLAFDEFDRHYYRWEPA